ncbi:MAG: hypothetical protein WC722_17420, partial [Rhodospirillales bacterium]
YTLEKRSPDYPHYAEVMRDVAHVSGVPLVDRYAAMRRVDLMAAPAKPESDELLAPDRLHLNDDGYRCLARAVADFIACGRNADCPSGRVAANRKGP